MKEYKFITLRGRPDLKNAAARRFHRIWGVPEEVYLGCMEKYLEHETEYGWYFCLDGDKIIGGLGTVDNDFHERKDLSPNICAVCTDEEYRGQGIAGKLLDLAVSDLRANGISPVYLVTDLIGFYERYGWEFLCTVRESGVEDMTRMYIHR